MAVVAEGWRWRWWWGRAKELVMLRDGRISEAILQLRGAGAGARRMPAIAVVILDNSTDDSVRNWIQLRPRVT